MYRAENLAAQMGINVDDEDGDDAPNSGQAGAGPNPPPPDCGMQ